MFKKLFIALFVATLFFTGCNDDKIVQNSIDNKTLKLTNKNVLMFYENSNSSYSEAFKVNDIRRVGYATVPYKVTFKDNSVTTKNGTALLIEAVNGKTFQILLPENSNVVNILKSSGFNVIEAYIQTN